jgi:hypothetical protein
MILPRTARLRRQRAQLIAEFFEAYGGARCVGTRDGQACIEATCDPEALTVAHLFEDGKSRRIAIYGEPCGNIVVFLRQLKAQGWPQDQGLAPQCGNCQLRDMRRMRREDAEYED